MIEGEYGEAKHIVKALVIISEDRWCIFRNLTECPNKYKNSLSHSDVLLMSRDVEDTDEHQDSAHAAHAPNVDGVTAKIRHESKQLTKHPTKARAVPPRASE